MKSHSFKKKYAVHLLFIWSLLLIFIPYSYGQTLKARDLTPSPSSKAKLQPKKPNAFNVHDVRKSLIQNYLNESKQAQGRAKSVAALIHHQSLLTNILPPGCPQPMDDGFPSVGGFSFEVDIDGVIVLPKDQQSRCSAFVSESGNLKNETEHRLYRIFDFKAQTDKIEKEVKDKCKTSGIDADQRGKYQQNLDALKAAADSKLEKINKYVQQIQDFYDQFNAECMDGGN